MNTGIEKQNTDAGIVRFTIYSWFRYVILLVLTAASAIYIVNVYKTYRSPTGSKFENSARARLVSGDKSASKRLELGDAPGEEELFDYANQIDEEIRFLVSEKNARNHQRVPGGEVFETIRELRISEIKSELEGFTEFPEGSLQWQRLNRLQQLENNTNH